jgi:hypothetical protein
MSVGPVRYRIMMVPAFLEKASYAVAVFWLFSEQRVVFLVLSSAIVDTALGILFMIAFWKTGGEAPAAAAVPPAGA